MLSHHPLQPNRTRNRNDTTHAIDTWQHAIGNDRPTSPPSTYTPPTNGDGLDRKSACGPENQP